MARGLYGRFPDAAFVHHWDKGSGDESNFGWCSRYLDRGGAREGSDDRGALNILVVDSVVNRGDSIRRFLADLFTYLESSSPPPPSSKGTDGAVETAARHRKICCVHVLTGVMQKKAAEELPAEFPRVRFVTLRVSDNQYVGKGGTDTGNRLFGTSTA